MPDLTLEARSALGTAPGEAGQVLVDGARLRIAEVAWLHVYSLRASRMNGAVAGLTTLLAPLSLNAPDAPNRLQGSLQRSCAWLEPHAWLLVSDSAVALDAPPQWLVTEISDRVAVFSVAGDGARDLIAAGCDPQLLRTGTMARLRFAAMANVIVEQWADDHYRLLIDVSIASVFASWLTTAAGQLSSN
ncbi:MAG TPA: hypothetical protein VGE51_02630 [Fontimonas sp.]